MLAVAEKVKTCSQCCRDRPLIEFRLRVKGGEKRHAECSRCHATNTNRRNAKLRSRDAKKFIAKLAVETEWERVITLCRAAFERFGGSGNFFTELMQEIERQPANSTLRARGGIVIANLFIAAEQQRANPSIHVAMSSDILEFYEHRLRQMIREKPRMVLLAAAAEGWEVREPGTREDGSPRRGTAATDQ